MEESLCNWPARRPLIGVAPRTEDRATKRDGATIYAQQPMFDAIEQAGGIPVMLPGPCGPGSLARMVETFDAFVIPGGYDCNPELYGEHALPTCGPISPMRDRFECALIPRIIEAEKPLLTICRGTQMLNVALGGSLWQDIPTQPEATLNPVPHAIRHSQSPDTQGVEGHEVSVYPRSLLGQVMGSAPQDLHVNSLHHQSIHSVARGLVVNAPDASEQLGNRVLSYLLGGLGGGAVIGWVLDTWLGTSPWLLLTLLFLGTAAGFRNIIKLSSKRPE